MIATADDWQRVGDAIQTRMVELSIGPADVQALGGPTGKPLTNYLAGTPIKRRDVKRRLCKALGWAPNSIDRIVAGEEPTVVTDNPGEATADEAPRSALALLEAMENQMGDLEGSVSAIDEKIANLRSTFLDVVVELGDIREALRSSGIDVPRPRRSEEGS